MHKLFTNQGHSWPKWPGWPRILLIQLNTNIIVPVKHFSYIATTLLRLLNIFSNKYWHLMVLYLLFNGWIIFWHLNVHDEDITPIRHVCIGRHMCNKEDIYALLETLSKYVSNCFDLSYFIQTATFQSFTNFGDNSYYSHIAYTLTWVECCCWQLDLHQLVCNHLSKWSRTWDIDPQWEYNFSRPVLQCHNHPCEDTSWKQWKQIMIILTHRWHIAQSKIYGYCMLLE